MLKFGFVFAAMVALVGCMDEAAGGLADGSGDDFGNIEERPQENRSMCRHPVRAVLSTMHCIERKDAECAAAGYSPEFVKLHNGVDTNTQITGPEFWQAAFSLVDLHLDYDHVRRVGIQEVSLRYIETVSFITGDVFYQHEHALVSVDADCRITLWDQYGDNQEQKAVDDKVVEIISGAQP